MWAKQTVKPANIESDHRSEMEMEMAMVNETTTKNETCVLHSPNIFSPCLCWGQARPPATRQKQKKKQKENC